MYLGFKNIILEKVVLENSILEEADLGHIGLDKAAWSK